MSEGSDGLIWIAGSRLRALFPHSIEYPVKDAPQLGAIQLEHIRTYQDDHIHGGQTRHPMPETLPADAADTIALVGTPYLTLGNGETNARLAAGVFTEQNRDATRRLAARIGKDIAEILGARKTQASVKTGPCQGRFIHHARRPVVPGDRQTARRLRPLARRALSTARPPRVFMRARKPCVR